MTPTHCATGKKKSSYKQAKKEARWMKRNKRYSNLTPNAYYCKVCNHWHVGNR